MQLIVDSLSVHRGLIGIEDNLGIGRTGPRRPAAVTYSSETARTTAPFSTALEHSARESISLLQARAISNVDTHGPGTLLDFALRLLGNVLLAFAILALRARTKR